MDYEKKQVLAVSIFLLVIVLTIGGLVVTSFSEKKKKNNTVTPVVDNNSNTSNYQQPVPEVEGSEDIEIITSNDNSDVVYSNSNTTTSTSNSSNSSNSANTKSSNGNIIPVSYFITKVENNKIYVGGTTKVNVTIKPDNATNKAVTYVSLNPSIAIAYSDGKIVGLNPGVATIKVNVIGGGVATFNIEVLKNPYSNSNSNKSSNSNSQSNKPSNSNSQSNKPSNSNSNSNTTIKVSSVSINRSSISLLKGNTTQLSATVSPSNATNKAVTWSSSNTSVATVSNTGLVTAKAAGSAIITVTTKDGSKKANCSVTVTNPKNGWVTENGKRYYYENNKKVTNTYRQYVYLGSDGAAWDKIGPFDVTLYGATAWATSYSTSQPYLIMTTEANLYSSNVKTVYPGTKVKIISNEVTNNGNSFIKIKYGKYEGWVLSDHVFINLPDIMPSMTYDITSASTKGAISKSAGYSIPGVTGVKLYNYSKTYNEKISRNEYYAPLLYPVAKRLQTALKYARNEGYSFKIYDTYRPGKVEKFVNDQYKALYNSNATVRAKVDRDANGVYWGPNWFMTTNPAFYGKSAHCLGIAIDMSLMKNGKELKAQSPMDTLDTSSLIKYNNVNSNKLASLMIKAGFGTLESEWWHFQDNKYNTYNRVFEQVQFEG